MIEIYYGIMLTFMTGTLAFMLWVMAGK